MLTIEVVLAEEFNDETERFETSESVTLVLEHSLASVSKWEQTFEKPFLTDDTKTPEETVAYVSMMTLTPNVPPEVYLKLSNENIDAVNQYIGAKMTATWFRKVGPQSHSREVITAEIIYYWMLTYNIWLECENWHLNKLLTLIKVCNEKNAPPKKMSRQQQLAERQKLNAQRLAQAAKNR